MEVVELAECAEDERCWTCVGTIPLGSEHTIELEEDGDCTIMRHYHSTCKRPCFPCGDRGWVTPTPSSRLKVACPHCGGHDDEGWFTMPGDDLDYEEIGKAPWVEDTGHWSDGKQSWVQATPFFTNRIRKEAEGGYCYWWRVANGTTGAHVDEGGSWTLEGAQEKVAFTVLHHGPKALNRIPLRRY